MTVWLIFVILCIAITLGFICTNKSRGIWRGKVLPLILCLFVIGSGFLGTCLICSAFIQDTGKYFILYEGKKIKWNINGTGELCINGKPRFKQGTYKAVGKTGNHVIEVMPWVGDDNDFVAVPLITHKYTWADNLGDLW